MEKEPLISIIVLVYQVQEYLKKCVDSIVTQTYRNLEIILVDDGSTDNSGAMCDEYARSDSRIKVIHKKNGGQSSARNAGLKIASGDMIGFVDSDDWIEPEMYQCLQSIMTQTDSEIAICKIVADEKPSNLGSVSILDMETAMTSLLTGGSVSNSVWDKLFSKNVWEGISFPEGMIMEDAATVYKCILKARRIVITDMPFYHYQIRQGSTLHDSFSVRNFDSVKAVKIRLDDISMQYPKLKQEAVDAYVWTVLYCVWWADHAAHGKYNKERQKIAEEMLEYLGKNRDISVNSRVSRNKIFLLKMGLPIYDFVWRNFHRVLRWLHH